MDPQTLSRWWESPALDLILRQQVLQFLESSVKVYFLQDHRLNHCINWVSLITLLSLMTGAHEGKEIRLYISGKWLQQK